MKRFLLIAGTAALLLTSCSEEKFLNDVGVDEANKASQTPIEFMASRPNQSRATNLETETNNFGVFGIKANGRTDIPTDLEVNASYEHSQLVFNNYLVGYKNDYPLQEGGFTETGEPFSSNWYYEGLGTKEYKGTGVTESAWENQYMKYWDGSKEFTYFVAYTPYKNTTPPVLKFGADDNHILQLEFPYAISTSDKFMFAARQELISSHLATSQTDVPLYFHRCQAQIRIAFYEVIKGYKVKMINVDNVNTDAKNNYYGVTALPYDPNGDDNKWGSITISGKPVLNFKNPTSTTASENLECDNITYKEPVVSSAQNPFIFNFAVPAEDQYLTELRSNKVFSPTDFYVFPNSNNKDLQFVLSFTLVAEDTGEKITVRNARVNIAHQYTDWQANCVYTYVFKITKDTNGTTATLPDGDDARVPMDPVNTQALYPIVFDQLTVADITTGPTYEYTLYDSNNPTSTGEIFNSDPAVKDYATVAKDGTLDLKDYMKEAYKTILAGSPVPNPFAFTVDAEFATVSDQGVLTPQATAVGKSFPVSVTYTKDDVTIKDTMIVTVIGNDVFLKSPVVECHVNDVNKLSELLQSGVLTTNVTLQIYDPGTDSFTELNTDITNEKYEFKIVASPDDKTIKFLTTGSYLMRAVNSTTNPAQIGYFRVNVLPVVTP